MAKALEEEIKKYQKIAASIRSHTKPKAASRKKAAKNAS